MKRLFLLILFVLFACETYDAPPSVTLVDLRDGKLADPAAPLVLHFSEPIVKDTLSLKIAIYEPDREGNLADEDESEETTLKTLFTTDKYDGDRGGTSSLQDDDSTLVIYPQARLPVGARLVLLIDAGLADRKGNVTRARKRILFTYEFKCAGNRGTKLLTSGTYFYVIDVAKPIGIQVQLYGVMDVDPATGLFRGQFTNADRHPDRNRCPTPCAATETCRLLPEPRCVAPSERAGGSEEYPDFVPNSRPPTGYSFTVDGCAEDQGEAAIFSTAPSNMVVQQPAVTVQALSVTGSFTRDAQGILRATGTFAADQVVIGTAPSGSGEGTLTARLIPAEQVPPGVPQPPPRDRDP
jgi:hypothetical protein